jgi:hypothetical protein
MEITGYGEFTPIKLGNSTLRTDHEEKVKVYNPMECMKYMMTGDKSVINSSKTDEFLSLMKEYIKLISNKYTPSAKIMEVEMKLKELFDGDK